MTERFSRRQVLKLGVVAPAAVALAARLGPAAAAATTSALPSVVPSRKKGVGVATGAPDAAERVQAMNPVWYYTWAADGIADLEGVEFVPMVWGGTTATVETQIAAVRALGPGRQPIVLGPNEPDNKGQSDMAVSEVLDVWPEIRSLAALTVAPAPVNPFDSWYTEFVQEAAAAGLHYDYVAVHNYPGADAAGFLQTIDQVYATYGLPIWITEFAVADWTATPQSPNIYSAEDVLKFMMAVLPELERRPYVARYAWFGAGPAAATNVKLAPSALFDSSGSITELGEYYAAFGTAAASPVQAGGAGWR